MSLHFHTVDLFFSPTGISVQWCEAPGEFSRPVEPATHSRIDEQRTALEQAERHGTPAALAAAQRQLGETLFSLLDGPERALQRHLDTARSSGEPLHLVLRLRASDSKTLPHHPALGWHLQLLTPPPPSSEEPLALQRDTTLTVQLGEIDPAPPVLLKEGRFQFLFMASSPSDVEPVLDYEAEEERILDELAPFVEQRRMVVRVAEEGSLADLKRRLMRRAYDIVHLSGHGLVTDKGPRLIMEDELGAHEEISPEQLLEVFRAGRVMPHLVVLSSCHTAEQRSDLPSLAAELLQGGLPCVVGWTRPVGDGTATLAAAELYQRLCSGEVPSQALARARQRLHEEDVSRPLPRRTHAWATLQLLTTQPGGFAINPEQKPAREEPLASESTYRLLGRRMRVLERGFVGRRRELQALGRVLRRGTWAIRGEAERPVAGAAVIGMKGQGKSCLVGRAVDRHLQDIGELGTLVLPGMLDELSVAEAFRSEALRLNDSVAEAVLNDGSQPPMRRLERILRSHWREHRLVIILDDFEQNLDIPGEGEARLQPLAAALLEVLVPACLEGHSKLLITSTARFTLPARLQGTLAEVELGALDGASIRKLWMRGQKGQELSHVLPSEWALLSERLGRNARILDWARQLLGGKTPAEVREIATEAGHQLPVWTDSAPDKAQQDALVALFLRHMAFEEARAKVGPDALTFLERARVYEEPVPEEALAGLTEGLSMSLERNLVALANLGLLEVGRQEEARVYRVSPLVKEVFDAPDGERWHAVAAAYWWKLANRLDEGHAPWVLHAWRHALQARHQALADEAADLLHPWLDHRGHFEESAAMGQQHLAAFPNSVAGLQWAGYARYRAGQPREGLPLLQRSVELARSLSGQHLRLPLAQDFLARVLHTLGDHAEARKQLEDLVTTEEQRHPEGSHTLSMSLHSLAIVLQARGDLPAARSLLERAIDIDRKLLGTEEHYSVAKSLHTLAGVLQAQGDLPTARSLLERSLLILKKVLGTEEHHDVSTSLHNLAMVLHAQGDLPAARSLLERSLLITKQILGTEEHLSIATSLHELARILQAQGDLPAARSLLERSLLIKQKVLGTEEHPSVATSLHTLAGVLLAQGDLPTARSVLERILLIQKKVLGTEEHPSVAASLHMLANVLLAQGDLPAARSCLERSIDIDRKLLGTEEHHDVAASLHTLAGVLQAQGDLPAARSLLERTLLIQKKVLGTEEHHDVAASLHELAGVLLAQGDLLAARSLLERAIDIDRKLFGTEEHPSVAASLHELAGVLQAQGDLPGARSVLERSLLILKKVLGTEEHPSVATSLHTLAGVLLAQGDLPAARSLLERSLLIKKKVLGTEEHHDVAASLHMLANVLRAQGDLPAARSLLERSLLVLKKLFGTEEHPDVAVSYINLATCLQELGLLEESEAAFLKALAILERAHHTRDHYVIAEAEALLSLLLLSRDRKEEALPLLRHALPILQAQVPNHPILRRFQKRA